MNVFELVEEHFKMQQGGTWEKQKAKVQKENYQGNNLLEMLQEDKDLVERLSKKDRIKKETNIKTSDNTKVNTKNKPELISKSARNKTDKEIAEERKARIEDSEKAQDIPYTANNWREVLARETQATGDKFRFSDSPNFFDDYLNPAVMIGDMASNLGQAPLRAQQEDSYMPYVTAVGTPLAVGAMAGIGTQNTGQFVNNMANPLAGIKTSISPELRQGLQSNGFLDMFKSKPKFQSEINWGQWNKEIPDNPQLMQEYNAIEQQAKANGTWMKNPDGSEFKGTSEQFVQQNSENFKKAFGNSKLINPDGSPELNYHSTYNDLFDTFDINKFDSSTNDGGWYGKGFYTSPNEKWANRFGDKTLTGYLNIENPVPNNLEVFFGRKGYGSTPELGKFNIEEKLKNYDGVITSPNNTDVERVFNNPSNFKSAIGNNGMFDMTNPNIYKSIAPIAGASYLATQGQEEPKKFQQGGKFTENENKFLEELAQLKLI
jgi:hypothetical protein